MALMRKSLKAMGLTDEQVDSIIEMHSETVDGLKEQIKTYEAAAKKLPGVQKELDDLKAAGDGGWKEKYEKEHKDFADYKAKIDGEKSHAVKEAAVMEYLKSKNIVDGNLKIAMLAIGKQIDAAELDGEKLKDTKVFDDLIAGDLKGLVTTTKEKPAPNPANPPKNIGGSMTKDEIFKITDRAERRAAIAANMNLFEKGD